MKKIQMITKEGEEINIRQSGSQGSLFKLLRAFKTDNPELKSLLIVDFKDNNPFKDDVRCLKQQKHGRT